jgi:hypothetical protein
MSGETDKEVLPTEAGEQRVSSEEEFRPTPAMILWADTKARMVGEPNTAIAEEANIAEQTFYRWRRTIPGFMDWYIQEYRKRRYRIIPELDELTMKYAKRGSFQHLELMTKKVGDYPQEAPTQATQVVVNNVVEKQKDKYNLDE